jgi:DNA-binding NtrC family response regulator
MRTAPTIIVAGDTEAPRRTLVRALVRAGYWVLEAQTCGEALAMLDHEGKVDLLVAGVDLPEMSGVALAGEFKARNPGVQVLFTSSGPSEGASAGTSSRPLTVQELLDQVRDLVGLGLLGSAVPVT